MNKVLAIRKIVWTRNHGRQIRFTCLWSHNGSRGRRQSRCSHRSPHRQRSPAWSDQALPNRFVKECKINQITSHDPRRQIRSTHFQCSLRSGTPYFQQQTRATCKNFNKFQIRTGRLDSPKSKDDKEDLRE